MLTIQQIYDDPRSVKLEFQYYDFIELFNSIGQFQFDEYGDDFHIDNIEIWEHYQFTIDSRRYMTIQSLTYNGKKFAFLGELEEKVET